MDIIKDKPMALKEVLRVVSGQKVIAGAKQIRKAFVSGTVHQVYLAIDADPAVTEPILTMSQLHNAQITWVRSMTDLGHACGIEVGAAAAAVVNPH